MITPLQIEQLLYLHYYRLSDWVQKHPKEKKHFTAVVQCFFDIVQTQLPAFQEKERQVFQLCKASSLLRKKNSLLEEGQASTAHTSKESMHVCFEDEMERMGKEEVPVCIEDLQKLDAYIDTLEKWSTEERLGLQAYDIIEVPAKKISSLFFSQFPFASASKAQLLALINRPDVDSNPDSPNSWRNNHIENHEALMVLLERELKDHTHVDVSIHFLRFFQDIQACDVAKALNIYYKNKNSFYILVLCQAIFPHLEPTIQTPREATIDQAISSLKAGCTPTALSTYPHSEYLIELLCHLDRDVREELMIWERFVNFAIWGFQTIAFDAWKSKRAILIAFVDFLAPESRQQVAKAIQNTTDPTTKQIGNLLERAFAAESKLLCMPFVIALIKHLPDLKTEKWFDIDLPPFKEKWAEDDLRRSPAKTHQLSFNRRRPVIAHDSLLIGMYAQECTSNNRRESSIIAYDMYTHDPIWAYPLPSIPVFGKLAPTDKEFIQMQETALGLLIIYENDPNVLFLDVATGKEVGTVTLPVGITSWDTIHITPELFCYFRTEGVLFGGFIKDFIFTKTFQIEQDGELEALGPFLFIYHNMLLLPIELPVVCDQQGKKTEIPEATTLLFRNEKIYGFQCNEATGIACLTIQEIQDQETTFSWKPTREITALFTFSEETSDHKTPCTATAVRDGMSVPRTAKLSWAESLNLLPGFLRSFWSKNDMVIEKVNKAEITYTLPKGRYKFVDVMKDGIWVVKNDRDIYFFLDIEKNGCTPGPKLPSYGEMLIDRDKSAIWSWNQCDKQLCKHTIAGSQTLCTLDHGRGTTLLHVDKNDELYFVDIEF